MSPVRKSADRRCPPVATEFFRTPPAWESMTAHLNALTAEPVIWSGACATGQEAYSAAILAVEEAWGGQVLATDISPECLDYARRGEYHSDAIARDLVEGRLTMRQIETYFELVRGRDAFAVTQQVKSRVSFAQGELGVDRPPACHVALVRNVWRHLRPESQSQLVVHIHDALLPGGLLFLGGADFYSEHEWTETGDLVEKLPTGLTDHFTESDLHELIWVPR